MMHDPQTRDLSGREYVLITSAHNEEQNIERTIKSVASQTLLPKRWIIVSDGSTDHTEDIVLQYTKQIPFLACVSLPPGRERSFVRQVKALQVAAEALKDSEYDFIGTLDADLSFGPDYFNRLLTQFERDPKLGMAGGMVYERRRGQFRPRPGNRTYFVAGAVQLFRRPCYEAVGGLVPLPYGGHDALAAFRARSLGWGVRSIPELVVYHYRDTGAAAGALRSKFRVGLNDYFFGYHPIFEIIKCAGRLSEKPFLIGAAARLFGFLSGYSRGEKRLVEPTLIDFLRKEQKQQLKSLALKPFS